MGSQLHCNVVWDYSPLLLAKTYFVATFVGSFGC